MCVSSSGQFWAVSSWELVQKPRVFGRITTMYMNHAQHVASFGGVPGAAALVSSSVTVTDLARLRGWSTSNPRSVVKWYESSCRGMMFTIGCKQSTTSGT